MRVLVATGDPSFDFASSECGVQSARRSDYQTQSSYAHLTFYERSDNLYSNLNPNSRANTSPTGPVAVSIHSTSLSCPLIPSFVYSFAIASFTAPPAFICSGAAPKLRVLLAPFPSNFDTTKKRENGAVGNDSWNHCAMRMLPGSVVSSVKCSAGDQWPGPESAVRCDEMVVLGGRMRR